MLQSVGLRRITGMSCGATTAKYLFFTGKGGVGKTSVSSAAALELSDSGKRVLLISTDPASNLQDVFGLALTDEGTPIPGAPGLFAANLDPIEAARQYRENVVGPYRGKLPWSAIEQMEEQLSGSCTVEVAAFDRFSHFLADSETAAKYDHIVFDTAPTGHTLRMLKLPSAWTDFIATNTHGASCLGQLAGLGEKKDLYREAVENLADAGKTLLVLVSRPEESPLREAARSARELAALGINNQMLVVNGIVGEGTDEVSRALYEKQRTALADIPQELAGLDSYRLPLRPYNIMGLERLRSFFKDASSAPLAAPKAPPPRVSALSELADDLFSSGKRVIFAMGKGGVGKTAAAAAIAIALAKRGAKVRLATTDPAGANLESVIGKRDNISLSMIDEEAELRRYREEVLSKARASVSADDYAYIEEDLRSPCTQEIAVFRAFSEIVAASESEVVVIDTAPTGHTLLLLDAARSHHREVERTKGEIPASVANLLPKLRDADHTEVVIVTLPEPTPVFEALRLREDLVRAGIPSRWWIANRCLSLVRTNDPLLSARASEETKWLREIAEASGGHVAAIGWKKDPAAESLTDTEEDA